MTNDEQLLAQFEDCSLPFDEWNHRAHLKIAYLYLTRSGLKVAAQNLRDGIRAYNARYGVQDTPTSGYHETMTQAWLRIIWATLEQYGPKPTADAFIDSRPQHTQKTILRLFYSRALFTSPLAKSEFLEPDLTNFPLAISDAGVVAGT